jgi:hypothetical protein
MLLFIDAPFPGLSGCVTHERCHDEQRSLRATQQAVRTEFERWLDARSEWERA